MAIDQGDTRRKRLLHTARYRGFKEADILVGGFAEATLAGMTDVELDAFEAILAVSDHDLYEMILGDAPPPAGVDAALIDRMRAFNPAGKT